MPAKQRIKSELCTKYLTMQLSPDFSDPKILEKYSSAFTLSDMEIFVFPELLYSLVIANIMSPIIWQWRNDEWFKGIEKKSFNFKINRIKQYIMEHYVFNLDLETWGLTDKETEINRFKDSMDIELLKKSNALFGYEGDKYYFDIDIRRHFGLDNYNTDIIPYWKTETVEAMTAFRHKESFEYGAGECVSLSALYAAALFLIGGIPLENIYLMGTPLHSQNFIDINEGVLTNNRRIVTKRMWFNGSSISTRARRALENEKVTIVSHISGYIHQLYETATINRNSYKSFSDKLNQFLATHLSAELFINFLRYHMKFKKCFQSRHLINARCHYIPLETLFEYEHSTKHSFSDNACDALIYDIDDEEFSLTPLKNQLVLQDVLVFLKAHQDALIHDLMKHCMILAEKTNEITQETIKMLFSELEEFLTVVPRLPGTDKQFTETERLNINVNHSRPEILEIVTTKSAENELALLSLYSYRQMDLVNWKPFLKAAIERNPVSLEGLKDKAIEEVFELLKGLPNESIYDGKRLAQPDEVWNFGRGDGIEKAILLANFLNHEPGRPNMSLAINDSEVTLEFGEEKYRFHSGKGIQRLNESLSF